MTVLYVPRALNRSSGGVHGGGRSPSKRDSQFKPDPAELEAWSKANRRARWAYYSQPIACTALRWSK